MKALGKEEEFPALASKIVLVLEDTRGGRSKICRRLGVSSNKAYLIVLDSRGLEISRRMYRSGSLDRSPSEIGDVIGMLRGALASPRGLPLADRLRVLLDHADPAMRADAVELLGRMGKDAQIAIPVMLRRLRDHAHKPSVAWHTLFALRRLGPVAIEAVPALVEVAADTERSSNDRQVALMALGAIDPKSTDVLAALGDGLDGESGLVIGAAIGVQSLKAAAAPLVPVLIRAYKRMTSRVSRCYIVDALAAIGPGAKEALPLLRAAAAKPVGKHGRDFNLERKAAAAVRRIETR